MIQPRSPQAECSNCSHLGAIVQSVCQYEAPCLSFVYASSIGVGASGKQLYPLAVLRGKMVEVFAQRSKGCEFKSHPDQTQWCLRFESSHSESLCNRDYPPDPDQKLG